MATVRQQRSDTPAAPERDERVSEPIQTTFDDPLTQRMYDALVQAGRDARRIARETRTGIVIVKDGVTVEIPWTELEDEDLDG